MPAKQQLPQSFTSAGFGDFEQEIASARKILERFPDGKGDWRPHDKSRQIGQLAGHIAQLPALGSMILDKDGLDVTVPRSSPFVDTASEAVAGFDRVAEMLRESIANTSPETLDESWSLRAGEKVFITSPKRDAFRIVFLSHLIHHRAQLGVYYRLLGVPVPTIYGPTADESL